MPSVSFAGHVLTAREEPKAVARGFVPRVGVSGPIPHARGDRPSARLPRGPLGTSPGSPENMGSAPRLPSWHSPSLHGTGWRKLDLWGRITAFYMCILPYLKHHIVAHPERFTEKCLNCLLAHPLL